MKKFQITIDKWFDKREERWLALPIRKQRQYTLYFFTAYLLLTTGVIFKVWYDTSKSGSNMTIDHIENPVINQNESPAKLKDTISTIFKN